MNGKLLDKSQRCPECSSGGSADEAPAPNPIYRTPTLAGTPLGLVATSSELCTRPCCPDSSAPQSNFDGIGFCECFVPDEIGWDCREGRIEPESRTIGTFRIRIRVLGVPQPNHRKGSVQ